LSLKWFDFAAPVIADFTVVPLWAGATATVLQRIFYAPITVDRISFLTKQSRAKQIGYSWEARALELGYMFAVLLCCLFQPLCKCAHLLWTS